MLKAVGLAFSKYPEHMKLHTILKRNMKERQTMIETGEGIDWATGEALAFGSLLVEGNHVRLSGQVKSKFR
jgi:2-oxoglutarate dehydrogenase E1 component